MRTPQMHAAALVLLLPAMAACSAGGRQSTAPQSYALSWNSTLANLTTVSVAVNYASIAMTDGDRARATQLLAYARRYAQSALKATSLLPAAWQNASIGKPLGDAARLLSSAVAALQDDVAHGSAFHSNEVQNDRQRATLDVLLAATAAQRSYKNMGGRSADLESLQSATQQTLTSLDSMMGHGSDDDSSM